MLKTLIIFLLLTVPALAQPWPHTPPPIGNLFLKQEYWNYIKEAAQKYQISPYLIQAVCAIESRYDKDAKSGRCYGLMQLHQDTALKYGVDSHDPRARANQPHTLGQCPGVIASGHSISPIWRPYRISIQWRTRPG